MPKSIPKGYHTITSTLVVDGAQKAIDLYKKAFGATEEYNLKDPSGKIMHAAINIGDSKLFLCDPCAEMDSKAAPANFYLYLENVDSAYKKARDAGLQATGTGPEDMFWGDRIGGLKDPFGNRWTLATHVREVSDDEIKKAAEQMSKGKKAA